MKAWVSDELVRQMECNARWIATQQPDLEGSFAVAVGGAEVLVDAHERHAAGTAVRIRIPPDSLFLFPAPEAAPPDLRPVMAEPSMAPAVPA